MPRRSRSPDRSRDYRRRSRSPDRRDRRDERDRDRDRRRSRSRERDRRERDRSPRREERKPMQTNPAQQVKPHQFTPADFQGKTADEVAMMQIMGITGFDTTKGKQVDGNDMGDARVNKKRRYRSPNTCRSHRQYMNRKGGFNRPLDYVP